MELTNGQKLEVFQRLTKLEEIVHEIKTNDLVHIQREVTNIKSKLWWGITILIGNLVGMVISLGFLFINYLK